MIPLIWLAGTVLLLLTVSNVPILWMLPLKKELAGLSPIVRNICTVHHAYLAGVLAGMSALCFLFARELAQAGPLAIFLTGGMALFWGLRLLLQILYYDPDTRRLHRGWDVLFSSAYAVLTAIFLAAATGALR